MKEKVLLVVVDFRLRVDQSHYINDWSSTDILREMEALVEACGGEVVDGTIYRVNSPIASTVISKTRIDELSGICSFHGIDTVIFSCDLKGGQQRNLEKLLKVKVVDRTQLILDIFARRALSKEGKMQVELAQLQYLLPRLTGRGVELSRLGGGIATLGPGETKLEVDRRRISHRIARLKKELKQVAESRSLKRKRRKELGTPVVSLVGYTNAGKSSLLNALTDAQQVIKDGLFTTLDPLSRQLVLPNRQIIILSDTVGFMHDLPHRLIEAFKATLEEITEADLLLHVLDISSSNFRFLYNSVRDVLRELDAEKIPTVTVLNKIDRISDREWLTDIEANFQNTVAVSATTGENLQLLLSKIEEMLVSYVVRVDVIIPIDRMDLVNLAHKEGMVKEIEYRNTNIHMIAMVPSRTAGRIYKADIDHRCL